MAALYPFKNIRKEFINRPPERRSRTRLVDGTSNVAIYEDYSHFFRELLFCTNFKITLRAVHPRKPDRPARRGKNTGVSSKIYAVKVIANGLPTTTPNCPDVTSAPGALVLPGGLTQRDKQPATQPVRQPRVRERGFRVGVK